MTNFGTVFRFVLVGILNTFVGLSIIFSAKFFFGMGDVVSNATGYGVGLLASFSLNRYWTFRHSGSILRSMATFLVVQAAAYSLNLACVLGLIEYGIDSYLAQALGMPPYMVISYLGSRYLAFSPERSSIPVAYVDVIHKGSMASISLLNIQNSGRSNDADRNV